MRKTLTALAAAATIGITAVAAPTTASAQWGHHWGWGAPVAAGVFGGLAAGALIGSAFGAPYAYPYGAYAYDTGYGYPVGAYDVAGGPVYGSACTLRTQRFWDGFGWRIRRVRVCY